MKMVFDVARPAGRQPTNWVICLALALAVTTGCSKSSNTPPTASVSPDTSAAAPTTPAPSTVVNANPQPAPAANSNVSQQDMQALNRALMGWMIRNHRHPKTFEEFAGNTDYQIPAPPLGKKYTLNARGFIILVNSD